MMDLLRFGQHSCRSWRCRTGTRSIFCKRCGADQGQPELCFCFLGHIGKQNIAGQERVGIKMLSVLRVYSTSFYLIQHCTFSLCQPGISSYMYVFRQCQKRKRTDTTAAADSSKRS